MSFKCFEASLGLTYLPLLIQFPSLKRDNIFFCDSVKLCLPLTPLVYRMVYELFLLSMHPCVLMVKKVDCFLY